MNRPCCDTCSSYKYHKSCSICTSFGISLDSFDTCDFYCGSHQEFKIYGKFLTESYIKSEEILNYYNIASDSYIKVLEKWTSELIQQAISEVI